MLSQKQLAVKFIELRNLSSEIEWVEFKEARQNFSFEKLGQYFSALSNEANLKEQPSGWLVFGVTDKPPRRIVGTNYRIERQSLDRLKHEISTETNGMTFQEIYELLFHEGRVILFQVPRAPAGIPISWKGHFYGRDGESLVPLSIHEIEQIRGQASRRDWTAEICAEATFDDLDERALEVAWAKFSSKFPKLEEVRRHWDWIQFLDKSKITRNGKITRATILLLGRPEASHFLLPHPAQVSWRLDAEDQAYEHFGPPFLLTVEDVFRQIRNTRFRIQPFKGARHTFTCCLNTKAGPSP